MRVRHKDIKRLGLDQFSRTKDTGPCVENDSQLGDHHASSVPTVVGVVTSGA